MPHGWIDARPGSPAYCFAARKRRYPSEAEAQAALVDVTMRRNEGRAHRAECRFYECKKCKGWHLTSNPVPPAWVTP